MPDLYRDRRRARRLTLLEHFFWTVIVTGYVMVGVIALAYVAQASEATP